MKKSYMLFIFILFIFCVPTQHSILISNKEYKENNNLENTTEVVNTSFLQITKINNDEQVKVSLPNSNYKYNKIKFAVWSSIGGQDDIVWYESALTNNNFTSTILIKNHKAFGEYVVHAYGFDSKGNSTYLKGGSFKIDVPQIESNSFDYDPVSNNIDIKVKLSTSLNITNIQIPIWSVNNGQDDIVWYNATKEIDGTWVVHTNLSKHDFFVGNYVAHIYITTSNGLFSFIKSLNKTIIPNNRFSASVNSDNTGFVINYNNYANLKGYSIEYAVWSEAGGQDDIVWYSAKNGRADGIFSNHLNRNGKVDSGNYVVHFYVFKNGKSYFMDSRSFVVNNPISTTMNVNQIGENLEIYVKNVPNNVKNIDIPTWSAINGQDDIIWYHATNVGNGTWKVVVNLKKHHYNSGVYVMHAYLYGQKNKIIPTSFNVNINKGTPKAVVDDNNNTIRVTLENSVYVSENVSFAVWSEKGGQDDVVWYNAKKSGSNLYYDVPVKNHKTSGKYKVHIYAGNQYITSTDTINSVDSISCNVSISDIYPKNNVDGNGIYRVTINGIVSKSGVAKVEVPVWTTSNQSDIYWYSARKEGDTYVVDVNPSHHKYNSGDYHTHVYVTGNNGVSTCLPQNNVHVSLKINAKIVNTYKANTVLRVYNTSPSVKKVQLPTWSTSNGQDDVVWYNAVKDSDGSWLVTVKSSNHPPFDSVSHVTSHLYVNDKFEKSLSYDVKKYYLTPWYYSQLNPEWSSLVYGRKNLASTGCMPSSIAMALSGILDVRITPRNVADYLYFSTNEFNKFFNGSSGMAVKLSSIHYGTSYKVLNSYNTLVDSLNNGQIVIGAVGFGYFVTNPMNTHAIVMYGYENGKTNVYDPYNESKNGKYSVKDIFNQQSHVREDLNAGAAFHALY